MDKVYRIHGLVQGVGFRPYVAQLATKIGLSGYVRNSGGVVTVRAIGDDKAVEDLIHRLLQLDGTSDELPGAKVTGIESIDSESDLDCDTDLDSNSDNGIDNKRNEGFYIKDSNMSKDNIRIIPPDIATCDNCKRELFDKNNRRYRHPFISCVSCGPRFSIMHGVPYDRIRTTMAFMDMCKSCEDEYNTYGDVRHYAQTICCNDCGPSLLAAKYKNNSGKVVDIIRGDDALKETINVLLSGGVAAIKDIGGYHLATLADNDIAIKRLRKWKNREEKPFAVMFNDISEIEEIAYINEEERELLESPIRPIVLLDVKGDISDKISDSVTMDSRRLGAMLPCNPLQYLILSQVSPIVMTSGNRGGEPIITEDAKMLTLLDTGIPDIVLYHDREITNGLDDSIFQVTNAGDKTHIQIIRRARGIVPEPVFLHTSLERDAIACGGDLKSVFALARQSTVYMSGHFGDLYDARALEERNISIKTMSDILGIKPLDFICDKHPGYVSSKYALEKRTNDTEYYRVQHHHAHALSVMAEHGLNKAVAVVMDGTGFGDDGNVWGGEFLLCDRFSYARYGHLEMVRLLGGDLSAKDGALSAMAYMYEAKKRHLIGEIENPYKDNDRYAYMRAAIEKEINTIFSSSTGRLFDAVSELLGISHYNNYEGQSAMKLETCAEEWFLGKEDESLAELFLSPVGFDVNRDGATYVIDTVGYVAKLVRDIMTGCDRGMLAYAFHDALAEAICSVVMGILKDIKEEFGKVPVVLSGGCFANRLLLSLVGKKFDNAKIDYYINEKVPCTDGGIALGQIYALTK